MSPGHKKQMIRAVVDGLCSGRKGCRIMRLARSTWWYRAGERSDAQQQMVKRLHELSDQHPRQSTKLRLRFRQGSRSNMAAYTKVLN